MPREEDRTVYSTDPNFRLCPRCGQYPCRCPKPKSLPSAQQTAGIQRQTKGRGGKTVTVISGLQLTAEAQKELAKRLKQACGTGGTVKEDTIEIQGDHREKIAGVLKSLGYKTKFIGG